MKAKKGFGDHAGQVKLTVWLDRGLLKELDAALEIGLYPSRAEWIREMARRTIKGE